MGYNGSKAVLNTNSKKISIQETGTIIVTPGSKLVAAEKSLDLVPTEAKKNEEADGGIDIMPGAEVKVGGYTFTAGNGPSESNSDKPAARLHWLRKYDTKYDEQKGCDFSFELRFVEIQNISGNVQITGESGCTEIGLTDAFGLNHFILPRDLNGGFGEAWEACHETDVLSALSYIYVSDVRVTDYITKLNDTVVYEDSNYTADWLNAYLDTERYEELQEAIALGRTPLVNVTLSDTKDSNNKITSRVATLNATDNSQDVRINHTVTIPVGTTLIAKVPIVAPTRGGRIDVFGTLKSENDANGGLGVTSEMDVSGQEYVDPHELVMLMGWYGKYILNNGDTYYHEFVFPKDPEKVATPDMVKGIDCIGFTIQARKKYGPPDAENGIYYYWSYRSIDADTANDIPHLLVMKKANGAPEGKEVIPNTFGYDFIELDTLKAGYRPIKNQFEFERFLDSEWIISEIYIMDRFGGNPDAPGISYAQLFKATDGGYVNFVHDKFSTDDSCSIVLDKYINEWGEERDHYHLASADLTISAPTDSTTDAVRIKKGCVLTIERGASLIVSSLEAIAPETGASGKPLVMEYDSADHGGARLDVIRGGSIKIGEYGFAVPDNCTGRWEEGDLGLFINAEYDTQVSKSYIKIQLPENVIITKNGSPINETNIVDLNAWAESNGYRLEIGNKVCEIERKNEPDIRDEDINYFPSIKVGDSYFFTEFSNGTLVKGDYTKTAEKEFSTGSVNGLKAIWTMIEKPSLENEDVEPLWSTITLTSDISFENITMSLPGTIDLNGHNLSLENNANIMANVVVQDNSNLTIGKGCTLGTSMGKETVVNNNGRFTIKNGGVFRTQMGSKLRIASGAAFQIGDAEDDDGGIFYCGCIIEKTGEDSTTHGIWLMNDDGVAVKKVGTNARVLIEITFTDAFENYTDEEKGRIINEKKVIIEGEVKGLLHNDSISVSIDDKTKDPRF